MFKKLIEIAKERYLVVETFDLSFIIKFDYFTIKFSYNTEENLIEVLVQRKNLIINSRYFLTNLQDLFKNDILKMLKFMIYKSLEKYYMAKIKEIVG